ncbi:MAG: S-layer homology domain-containing protein [Clostridia bacterium]|nr:S-layer homology domain-containing protein [Clostridia bacterium]
MKRLLSLLVVLVLLGTKLVFAEEKTSGAGPAHFTFVQLTNLQIENIEKISIGCSKCGLGLSEYFVSSPLIISDIYNTFKDIQFTEDTRDGSAGGWVYGINFYMKDGTYVQFGTRLHIDKVDYNAVDFAVALEKMAYYHDLIEDIDSSEWAIDYILEFQKLGFLDGVTDVSYKEPVTREKFCKIIYNMLDRNMNIEWKKVSPNPFKDTADEKVISLRLEGIVNGKDDCKFAPDDYLTREEAATIIVRVMNKFMPDIIVTETYFNYDDIDEVAEWASDSVQLISNSGIMVGVGENKFSPQDTYTTEQAIASVVRLYNNILLEN